MDVSKGGIKELASSVVEKRRHRAGSDRVATSVLNMMDFL